MRNFKFTKGERLELAEMALDMLKRERMDTMRMKGLKIRQVGSDAVILEAGYISWLKVTDYGIVAYNPSALSLLLRDRTLRTLTIDYATQKERLLNAEECAKLMNYTVDSWRVITFRPNTPPKIRLPGGRVFWREEDVLAYRDSRRNAKRGPKPKKKQEGGE